MIVTALMRFDAVRFTRLLLCGLLGLATGCSMIPGLSSCPKPPEEPKPVHHVLSYWDNRVHVTSDPVAHGAPLNGLAARVYLFNDEIRQTVDAKGIIAVELHDMTQTAKGGAPNKLADWTFDTASLEQLKRKDVIGDGYTLFLPFENYHPDITQVKLQLAYVPENGTPHYTDPTIVTLRKDAPWPIQNRQLLPAQYRAPENRGAPHNAKAQPKLE